MSTEIVISEELKIENTGEQEKSLEHREFHATSIIDQITGPGEFAIKDDTKLTLTRPSIKPQTRKNTKTAKKKLMMNY